MCEYFQVCLQGGMHKEQERAQSERQVACDGESEMTTRCEFNESVTAKMLCISGSGGNITWKMRIFEMSDAPLLSLSPFVPAQASFRRRLHIGAAQ